MSKSYRRDLPIGTVAYYKDETMQELHRTDGPAIESPDGSKHWWVNGVRHRLDGPAIVYLYGVRSWYVNGTFICTVNKRGEIIDTM